MESLTDIWLAWPEPGLACTPENAISTSIMKKATPQFSRYEAQRDLIANYDRHPAHLSTPLCGYCGAETLPEWCGRLSSMLLGFVLYDWPRTRCAKEAHWQLVAE